MKNKQSSHNALNVLIGDTLTQAKRAHRLCVSALIASIAMFLIILNPSAPLGGVKKAHAAVSYNRQAAVNWAAAPASGTWGSAVGNYRDGSFRGEGGTNNVGRDCTALVARSLDAGISGGVSGSWGWYGNDRLINWMQNNSGSFTIVDPTQLVAGDFILYSDNSSAQSTWQQKSPNYDWGHSALVVSPGRVAMWNPEYFDVAWNDSSIVGGLPYRMGVHINDAQTAPTNTNLLSNGDFSNGTANWNKGGPMAWAVYSTAGHNYLAFKHETTSGAGGVYQWVPQYNVPPNSVMDVQIQLGNTSSVTKTVDVDLRNLTTWTGAFGCTFSIAPNTPLHKFIIRSKTDGTTWAGLSLELFVHEWDGIPDVAVYDASVQYHTDLTVTGTACLTGDFTSPNNGDTVGNTVHLAGYTASANSSITQSHFTASWPGHNWSTVSPNFSGSALAYDWNLCDNNIPANTQITLGLDFGDANGNWAHSPNGNPTITKTTICVPPIGKNLLVNGGFEQDMIAWQYNPNNETDCNRSTNYTGAYEGNKFLATNRGGHPTGCISVYQDVGFQPVAGDVYTATFYARLGWAGIPRHGSIATFGLGGSQENSSQAFTLSTTWECFSTTLHVANNGHSGIRVELYMNDTDPGPDYNFDAVTLARGTQNTCPATPTATFTPTNTPTPTTTPVPVKVDTIGIYRSGTFYLSLHNATGYADSTVGFNPAGRNFPVVGDWTGAGYDTVGVFDQNSGNFTLCTSNLTASCALTANLIGFTLGGANDTPLAGRWSSSATHAGAGVYRATNGILYLKNALNTGYADNAMVMGIAGDEGVAGDWTGKGFDSPGIYRPGQITFYLSNQVTSGSVYADINATYGSSTDLPVVGDWIAQGHDGIGMFRPTNGYVYLKNQITTGNGDNSFFYGLAGDVPVAGHWQLNYPSAAPRPIAPTLIPRTMTPTYSSGGSVPGGNGIGG